MDDSGQERDGGCLVVGIRGIYVDSAWSDGSSKVMVANGPIAYHAGRQNDGDPRAGLPDMKTEEWLKFQVDNFQSRSLSFKLKKINYIKYL